MRREWELEDLIAHWTLVELDWELVANKSGATRLGPPVWGSPLCWSWRSWLSRELCPTESYRDQLRDAVIARCRVERLEPPTFGQISRLVNSAVRTFEERFCRVTHRT